MTDCETVGGSSDAAAGRAARGTVGSQPHTQTRARRRPQARGNRTNALLLGRQLFELFKVVKLFLWTHTAAATASAARGAFRTAVCVAVCAAPAPYRLVEELAEALALLLKAQPLCPLGRHGRRVAVLGTMHANVAGKAGRRR